MKIGVMQPYFLPYPGYFSLIKHTDKFILLDTVQFKRHGWVERNRILKQREGWLYIKVPLERHDSRTLIKDIKVDNSIEWKSRILSQIEIYKKSASYYSAVKELIEEVFEQIYMDIITLNKTFLKKVCSYLEFEPSIEIFSEMKLTIKKPEKPDDWALNICKALKNVDQYWNPPGGQSFYDRSKYEKAGIRISFQSIIPEEYDQKRPEFEPDLSIIDAMMFNSPEKINKMLDNYELL